MKTWVTLLVSAGALSAEIRAQEPTVGAYLDPPEVAIGEQFRLVVEVNGARTVESVVIPEFFDFAQCINPYDPVVGVKVGDAEAGAEANTVTLSYVFFATQAGFFEMRPFRITADGQTMETEALALLVGTSEVTVEARVEPTEVGVEDEFELSVDVFGSKSESFEFVAPDFFDFAESNGGCGVAGRRFRCRMRARTPGEYVIPPIEVIDQENTYESEPVTLVITDEPPRVELWTGLMSGSIWVGGEFTFRFEVVGTHELDEEPGVPETGSSAELVRVGGPMLTGASDGNRMSYDYRFRALQPGRFEIGPLRIVADGRTFESDPVSVTVNEVPTGDSDPPDDLSLTGVPNRTRAYVGQPVVVTFSAAPSEDNGLRLWGTQSWPSPEGFDVLDRGHLPGKMALLPREPGQLEVGAATVEARIQKPWDPGLWDDDPLRQAQRRGIGEPTTFSSVTHWLDSEFTSHILTSDPFTLEVLPLPDRDRPDFFRGHVGTLEVASRLNGTRVLVGESLTLEVKVFVEGHVEGLADPEIDFPRGFEVSEPEMDTGFPNRGDFLSGSRTYTYRLTAVTPGTYVIPAVGMSYFNAVSQSYGTARGHAFTVTVVSAGAEGREED